MAGEKMETKLRGKIMEAVRAVKETNPMAGSVTNTVTMNFVANAQLAVGGSAAMVFLPDEGEFLDLVRMPFSELLSMVERGEIADAKTAVAVLQAWRILEK